MVQIGILQCDDVQTIFLAEHNNYPEMFQTLFLQQDASLRFLVYPVHQGIALPAAESCDGWIITGSRCAAYDKTDWMQSLSAWIVNAYETQQKVFGVCFGHQIIAQALCGRVEKSPRGWGVGVAFNRIVRQQPWMASEQPGLDLIVSHQDQVVELPEDATILATSDFCPYFMLQYGDHFLSVQGHPEFTTDYSAALMADRTGRIPSNRIREGLHSLTAPIDSTWMAASALRFFQA